MAIESQRNRQWLYFINEVLGQLQPEYLSRVLRDMAARLLCKSLRLLYASSNTVLIKYSVRVSLSVQR